MAEEKIDIVEELGEEAKVAEPIDNLRIDQLCLDPPVPMHDCTICLSSVDAASGIFCSENHFICGDDLARSVTISCQSKAQLKERKGRICCSMQNCGSTHWSAREIRLALRDNEEVLDVYTETLISFLEEEEIEDRGARSEILDALIMRCPNPRCRVAVVKDSGCNSIYCTCGRYFCYLCMRDSGSSNGQSHNHVQNCNENSVPGHLGSSFAEAHKRRRIENVRRVLINRFGNTFPTDAAASAALRECARELTSLGISEPEVLANAELDLPRSPRVVRQPPQQQQQHQQQQPPWQPPQRRAARPLERPVENTELRQHQQQYNLDKSELNRRRKRQQGDVDRQHNTEIQELRERLRREGHAASEIDEQVSVLEGRRRAETRAVSLEYQRQLKELQDRYTEQRQLFQQRLLPQRQPLQRQPPPPPTQTIQQQPLQQQQIDTDEDEAYRLAVQMSLIDEEAHAVDLATQESLRVVPQLLGYAVPRMSVEADAARQDEEARAIDLATQESLREVTQLLGFAALQRSTSEERRQAEQHELDIALAMSIEVYNRSNDNILDQMNPDADVADVSQEREGGF